MALPQHHTVELSSNLSEVTVFIKRQFFMLKLNAPSMSVIRLLHPWMEESSIDDISLSMDGIFISQISGENNAYNFHQNFD